MLKYLTQKLQNSAISEQDVLHKKVQIDEDQDSGTESDENIEDIDADMDTPSPVLIGEVTSTSSPYFSDSSSLSSSSRHPIDISNDLLYDAHSSEEELEVINNQERLKRSPATPPSVSTTIASPESSNLIDGSTSCGAEKRKWSQVNTDVDEYLDDEDYEFSRRQSRSSLSSDEEVTGLFSITSGTAPLQFRTSPPVNVLKPGGQRLMTSPPVKMLHNSISSPRKKYRHCSSSHPNGNSNGNVSQQHSSRGNINHIQRPCLDFEKMQEMKARAVTSWRHGGELSVFCW